MKAHTEEQFYTFLSQLKETNATLSYWTDFDKVKSNVARVEIKLNTLNYLLGKENLREAVTELWENDNRVFDVLQILVACRWKEKKKVINSDAEVVFLESYLKTLDGVIEYLEGTGLAKVFKDKDVKNLVDYVFGVEVGMDSHSRKNRGGDAMEDTVEILIKKAGLTYRKEVESSELPVIKEVLGNDIKRFDFVIYSKNKTYLMEVNFYNERGGKINDTARSFAEIGLKINALDGFEFIWVTDGRGWNGAKNKLEEAFFAIPGIYNLTTIKDFLGKIKNDL